MKVETTTVNQTGSDILETKDKKLHYLVITNTKGTKLIINTGQKVHDKVIAMVQEEEEPKPKGGK